MRAVDLFAGWGGFTLGAELAGVDVVWAANHWTLAVKAHQINHPETVHVCQDLRQANWGDVPDYELLLASPECRPHSSASQPRRREYHKELRATAWAVIDCIDATDPEIVMVENVPAFRHWPRYHRFMGCLEDSYPYVQERFFTASHHGTPQRRKRLFIIASKDPLKLDLEVQTEPAFGPCIEDDASGWRPVARASRDVQARIRKGRRNHGPRFISQHVTGHPGIGLDEPIRTITTQDQFVLVDGSQYRPLTIRETARGMGFPDDYEWPAEACRTDTIRGLANAVCPPQAKAILEAVV